jgi:hypothetical protein
VECVDAFHLDEQGAGGADRPAGEGGYSFTAPAASLRKISTGPLATEAKANGDWSGTVMPRAKPSVST